MDAPVTLRIASKRTILLVLAAVFVASYTLTLFYTASMSTIMLADATATYHTGRPSLVVSGQAITPQTSIVDKAKVEKIAESLPGVTEVEYQDLSIVIVNNKTAVVRGLEPRVLKVITGQGSTTPLGCAWPGKRALRRLGLHQGEFFTVYSPLSHRSIVMRVCGEADTDWPLSDEIITTVSVAGYLRGIPSSKASIAVLYFDTYSDRDKAMSELGIKPGERGLLAKALVALRYGYMPPESLQGFANRLLGTLDLDKTVITGVLIGLAAVVSAGLSYVGALAYSGERGKLMVLHMLGLSRRRLSLSYMLLLLGVGFLGSILGLVLAVKQAEHGVVELLGYNVPAIYSGWELAAVALLPAITISLGVLQGEGTG